MKSVKADQPRKCYKCSPETCAMSGLELSRNASSILKTKSNAYCYARSSTTRVPHQLKQLGLQAAVPWWWPHVSFNVVQSPGAMWSQRRGCWQADVTAQCKSPTPGSAERIACFILSLPFSLPCQIRLTCTCISPAEVAP